MKVSIVMTAYNVSQYIGQAIESCLNQTYKDIELVVVEDCSTDNTKEIVQSYADKDDRLKLVCHDQNLGAGWGRRTGIEESTGEYFITVDGDDWLDETFIESLVNTAKNTNADIVSGGITIERGQGYWEKTCYGNLITTGDDKVIKFWGEKVVFMNNKLIRKTLHDFQPYCTRRFIEDTPTIIPMLWKANIVAYTEDTGYHYRMQHDSLTHQASKFKYALFRALCCHDIIQFFNQHDKAMLDKIPMQATLQQQIDIIREIKPHDSEIFQYMNEWMELTKKLLL